MKLQYDEMVSNFALNFNVRRYTMGLVFGAVAGEGGGGGTGGGSSDGGGGGTGGSGGDGGSGGGGGGILTVGSAGWITGRGLHSYPIRLNVSTSCGIRWVHDFPAVY